VTNVKFSDAFSGYLLAQQARRVSGNYLALLALSRDYWTMQMGDDDLAAITPDHIRRWLLWLGAGDGKGLSGASVNIHYRNIKAFWLWCEREELVEFGRAPIRRVARPAFTEKEPDVLTEAEARQLLRAARNDERDPNAYRNYCILHFFLDTAVRLSELAGLDLRDVNLSEGYAKVLGKGNRERLVPLGLELRQSLSRYRLKYRHANNGEGALFTNDEGERFAGAGVRTMVVRQLKAHVPRELRKIGPHTLRHTAITLDLMNNGDINTTSKIAGHKSVTTTRRYDHLVSIMRARTSPMDAALKKTGGTFVTRRRLKNGDGQGTIAGADGAQIEQAEAAQNR
jgi:integrase/recombinase XerC